MAVEEQVAVIFAGTKGYLDNVPTAQVSAYEQVLLSALRTSGADLLASIRSEQKVTDDTEKKLASFLDTFTQNYLASAQKAA